VGLASWLQGLFGKSRKGASGEPDASRWPLFGALVDGLSPGNRANAIRLMQSAQGQREILALYERRESFQAAQDWVVVVLGKRSDCWIASFATPPLGGVIYLRHSLGGGDLQQTLNVPKAGCKQVLVG
jgi:hypothetical protein